MPDRSRSLVAVGLGSNRGERELTVLRAAGALGCLPGVSRARLSSLYESEPIGEHYSHPFVNAVMILETRLAPEVFHSACRRLEQAAGRRHGETERDRRLDIDIIFFGDLRSAAPDLILPHPRFRRRLFVLRPLAELDPGLALPPDGAPAAEAAGLLEDGPWVRRISARRLVGADLP